MPVELGSDIQVTELSSEELEHPPEFLDFKMQAARRKSRMTQFISQVKEGDDQMHDQTDVDRIMKQLTKKKRKRAVDDLSKLGIAEKERREAWGKLELKWIGEDYIMAKKPQTCLEELIAQKQTHKTHIKFHKLHCPKKIKASIEKMSGESDSYSDDHKSTLRESLLKIGTGLSSCESITRTKTEDSQPRDTLTFQVPAEIAPVTLPRIQEHGGIPSMSHASTPSTGRKEKYPYQSRGRRFSKSLFITKKDTGNEECYMYVNRVEANRAQEKMAKLADNEDDKSNIFYRTDTLQKRIERRYKRCTVNVPELKDRIPAETLVKAFISEQFLDMRLRGTNTDKVRKIYHHAILDQTSISTLLIKHPEILPTYIFKDLITYKKQYEVTPVYVSTPFVVEKPVWRQFFINSLTPAGGDILSDIEREVPLYANFYKNLIQTRAARITLSQQLIKERKKLTIREIIVHITLQLRMARHVPGSSCRLDLMSVMAAASYNETLLTMLALSVDDWLDQLAKCLGSSYKSVREETCQILCFMTTCYPLMRALYVSKYFDVVHDLVSVLLKSMDAFDDTFDDYYIVLTHLMHHCPSRGTLDCILDRLSLFKNIELHRRWPKLVYYALKYWPDDPLGIKSLLYGKRIMKQLEIAMQKPLTQKYARAALYHFQQRYNNLSRIFTIFTDKAEKAYMIALGFEE